MVLREIGIEWVIPEHLPSFTLKGLSEFLNSFAAQMNEDTVVFIDPVTKLPGYSHKDFISGAEKAMGIAKDRHKTLTTIVIAHHDEKKDSQSLDSCDIKGGDGLLQQAGAVMALRKERTGNEYRFIQCLKAPKGSPEPFDSNVLVMKLVNKDIDEHNRYPHFKYVDIKKVTEALPIKPKSTSGSVEISTVQPTSPQFDNTTNNLPEWKGKLPLGLAMQMKKDYKPGQAGFGLKQMAKKYGLKYEMDVKRELETLDKYLQQPFRNVMHTKGDNGADATPARRNRLAESEGSVSSGSQLQRDIRGHRHHALQQLHGAGL